MLILDPALSVSDTEYSTTYLYVHVEMPWTSMSLKHE